MGETRRRYLEIVNEGLDPEPKEEEDPDVGIYIEADGVPALPVSLQPWTAHRNTKLEMNIFSYFLATPELRKQPYPDPNTRWPTQKCQGRPIITCCLPRFRSALES